MSRARPAATSVLLVRHGQSTWNAAGRWQGWADPPLSPSGVDAVQALAPVLAPLSFDLVLTSDLDRAWSTAAILATALGLAPPTADARLRERDIGEWTGLRDDEIAAGWPGEPGRWRGSEVGVPPGGGEAAETVAERMAAALGDACRAQPGTRILAVSHGGAIRALERRLGGQPSAFGNLAGCWFSVAADGVRRGRRFDPAARPAPASGTRR